MATSLFEQKTEDELWIEYRKTHSSQIRDAFIRQYMPLVKYVAGKVSVGCGSVATVSPSVEGGAVSASVGASVSGSVVC